MNYVMGRRTVLATGAAMLLLCALGAPARADDAGAEAYVKGFVTQMAAIVNGPADQAAKKAALTPVVDANVDVPVIARFCLGRFWNSATPAQQQKYVAVFHRVMLNSIDDHLGEYQGVSFVVNGSRPQGDNAVVGSVITRPNAAAANVGWVVSSSSGAPKVVDVIAEGASLRIQQRSDYASYLNQHGNDIDALVAALERKVSGG
jgi:phospholipid transport system substrate-binding protein